MFLGHDWTWWLPILSVVAALLSVAAGTLAIFQEHHTQEGKLTRFGWTLAALIFASGAASLGLGVVDRRIGDEKEHADAAERDRQFQSQMSALRGVTGSLSQLQTDMRGSLGQQRQQFDVANRTLGMSEALQRQAQANTIHVLQRLFQESNRVSAERIAISVVFECQRPDEDSDNPQLFQANLVIDTNDGRAITMASDQKLQTGAVSIFHGFHGDLGPYESFEAWRTATIAIVLSAGTMAADGYSLSDLLRSDELRRQRGGRGPRPAECVADVGLLLNGRQVLSARRNFFSENGQYVAVLSSLRVDPRRLPHFAN